MLRKALIEALARSGAEAWRAIVTPVLVYESPVLATWSLRLRLIPEQGEPVLIVLDQEHQTPEHVSAALVAALAQRVP